LRQPLAHRCCSPRARVSTDPAADPPLLHGEPRSPDKPAPRPPRSADSAGATTSVRSSEDPCAGADPEWGSTGLGRSPSTEWTGAVDLPRSDGRVPCAVGPGSYKSSSAPRRPAIANEPRRTKHHGSGHAGSGWTPRVSEVDAVAPRRWRCGHRTRPSRDRTTTFDSPGLVALMLHVVRRLVARRSPIRGDPAASTAVGAASLAAPMAAPRPL